MTGVGVGRVGRCVLDVGEELHGVVLRLMHMR